MADDAGAPGTDEIARAYISIAADLSAMNATLAALPNLLKNPMTQAGTAGANYLTDAFDKGLSHLMGGHFGEAIATGGKALTRGLAELTGGLFKSVLGDTLGGIVSWVPRHIISFVGNTVSSIAGNIATAIFSPITAAMSVSLADFQTWTQRSIEAEAAMTRFTATADNMRATVGFSSDQLKRMAEGLSNVAGASMFSTRDIRSAEEALLQFDRVRGQVYRRTLELAVQMAAARGMSVEESVHTLGHALSDPEHGAHRLRRAGVFIGPQETDELKRIQETNGTLAAQERLLDLLKGKWSGAAAAMAGTTEGILGTIRSVWGEMGKGVGDVFLPLTKVAAEAALGIVRSLSGAAGPVLKDLAATTQRWADNIRGFFAENQPLFAEWSAQLREIVGNVYKLATEGFGALWARLDPGKAAGFWQSFSSGVTEALDWMRRLTSSWDTLRAAGEYAWLYVRNKFFDFADALVTGDTWRGLWGQLKSGFESFMGWLGAAFKKLSDAVGESFTMKILEGVRDVARAAGATGTAEDLQNKIIARKREAAQKAEAERLLGTEGPERAKVIANTEEALAKYKKSLADLEKKKADALFGLNKDDEFRLNELKAGVAWMEGLLDRLKAGEKIKPEAGLELPHGGPDEAAAAKRAADLAKARDEFDRLMGPGGFAGALAKAAAGKDLSDLLGAKGAPIDDQLKNAAKSVGFEQLYGEIRSGIKGSFQDKQLAEMQKQTKAAEDALKEHKRTNELIDRLKGGALGFGVA